MRDVKEFRRVLEDFSTAMLVTQNGAELRGRPMHVARSDEDGIIYFVSPRSSCLVAELPSAAAVTMQNANEFISLSGSCRLSTDPDLLERMHSPLAESWFRDYRREAAVVIFHTREAEYWRNDLKGVKFLIGAARAALQDEPIDPTRVGEHGRMEFDRRP